MTMRCTALGLAVAAASIGSVSLGCASIERLVADGQYQAAIDSAAGLRRPPRGKQARALARALLKTDRLDDARGVLFGDYQRGGDLTSLLMLGDVELGEGLDATAAVHLARLLDLDLQSVQGRQDVCALLRRRADGFARAGAGAAADRDLNRAHAACGEPTDPVARRHLTELVARTTAAQRSEIEARVANTRCRTGAQDGAQCDAPSPAPAIEAELAAAQAEGPPAVRRVAAAYGLSLPPEQVVALLAADLSGALSTTLVGDDEVRRWVGNATWSQYAPLVGTRTTGEAAYLQLRLAAVLPDLPVGPELRRGPTQRVVWAAQATDLAGAAAWRIFAWLGDFGATELALGTVWRPRDPATEQDAGTRTEGTDEVVAAPGHWTARLVPSVDGLEATLILARLRHARGNPDLALQIARHAIARATAAGVPDAPAIAARFAGWHLAAGRFWQALAVADAAPEALAPVAAAASTALLLAQAFCDGPCRDDQDAAVMERVMGETWRDQATLSLRTRATSGKSGPSTSAACPTVGERLASDGPLAAVIKVRDRADPALPRALARIVETDVTLGCAAWDATLLWLELSPSPTAESLAELLAHEPHVPTPTTLTTLARLAMLAGRSTQAENYAIAAAASARDPQEAWRGLSAFAAATGHRELHRKALWESLLHTPQLDAPLMREAMLVDGLADAIGAWGVTETPAGRATLARHVDESLRGLVSAQQWSAREALLWRVAEAAWWSAGPADAPWRNAVVDAVLGGAPRDAHGVGLARLEPTGSNAAVRGWVASPLDAAALTVQATAGALSTLPPVTAVFDDPVRLTALRLAIARHGADWQSRWRTAVGLAVYADARSRAAGVEALLAMASPAQREALVRLVLALPAGLSPDRAPATDRAPVLDVAPARAAGATPVSIVTDDEALFRLAAGLDVAPTWYAR